MTPGAWRHLGRLEDRWTDRERIVQRATLVPGWNDVGGHLVQVAQDGSVVKVIDKVCDHAGGRLVLRGNKAVCPMHGWVLDLDELRYNDSHVCKSTCHWEEDAKGDMVLVERSGHLFDPFKQEPRGEMQVRWLNHACVQVTCNGYSLITDPWLFGPAFMTGWWLAEPSPAESIELLEKADVLYISHNHPDHLHAETLAILPRDTPIIVPAFQTRSCEKYLLSLGFTNVIPLGFKDVHELHDGFHISVLKSGDFRDDAGLYLSANGHVLLLTVDCNNLNHGVLPRDVDLLMTSFAGGASGYPLCFEDLSEQEQDRVLARNRSAIKALVHNTLQNVKPRCYMPYAGMFTERAPRDRMVHLRNSKNDLEEYRALCKTMGIPFIEPRNDRMILFRNGKRSFVERPVEAMRSEGTDLYIDALKREYPYDAHKVVAYLAGSRFRSDRILYLVPTDDGFDPVSDQVAMSDFLHGQHKIVPLADVGTAAEGRPVTVLRVRAEVLMCVVENMLPWEDFSIGFQMRVRRTPNEYESDLWYHFTNVHIARHNFRYSSFCGACTVLDQRPIWSKGIDRSLEGGTKS